MSLPNVYQNKNIGNINNDQEYFYSTKENNNINRRIDNKENINIKINKLFSSNKFVYKIKVIIVTNNYEKETSIIGKVNNNLITIDNDLIPIKEIIDIYEK